MNQGKYVVLDDPVNGEVPILFPIIIKHSMIVSCIQKEFPGIKCISAGFFNEQFTCYGESQSLHLSSRNKKDTLLLRAIIPWEKCEEIDS
jgi:hypothetical protein